MWATIETLWERLSVETEVREIFNMQNRGFAPSTVSSVCLNISYKLKNIY